LKAYALQKESQISINVTNVIINSCLKNVIAGHISGNHVQLYGLYATLMLMEVRKFIIYSALQQHYTSGKLQHIYVIIIIIQIV